MPEKNEDIFASGNALLDDLFNIQPDVPEDRLTDEAPDIDKVISQISEHRQTLNVLIAVDVSGSMKGARIGAVNDALENVFHALKSDDKLDATIKVAILEFGDTAEWKMSTPLPLSSYEFTDIKAYAQGTCFAPVFNELNKKLSRTGFMDPDMADYFAPLILFITDGMPSDTDIYPAALERLNKNGWFKCAGKYAIAVGKYAKNPTVLRILGQFTGDIRNVRYADEGAALSNIIQYIAVRGSQVQTSLASASNDNGFSQVAGENSIISDMVNNGNNNSVIFDGKDSVFNDFGSALTSDLF